MLADGRLAPRHPSLFVWPGSHTKLVAVNADGRIARSFTTLAGEALQAIAHHTLLAASLPADWPDNLDRDAASAGAGRRERHGLGRAAFLVRIAALGGSLDDRGRAAFWIGAAVEADAIDLAHHPLLAPGKRCTSAAATRSAPSMPRPSPAVTTARSSHSTQTSPRSPPPWAPAPSPSVAASSTAARLKWAGNPRPRDALRLRSRAIGGIPINLS